MRRTGSTRSNARHAAVSRTRQCACAPRSARRLHAFKSLRAIRISRARLDAPCAASLADAFGCDTVALVLFPEAAAPASASPASRFALAVIDADHGRRLEARTGRSERD